MRTVAVVTGSRADFGIYTPVLKAIDATPGLQQRIYACGAHFSADFGNTVDEIEAAGFKVAEKIETFVGTDGPREIVNSMALGLTGFAEAFSRNRPDMVLVLGDRYEMFAATVAALTSALPIAHIHGGELSEGAIDDALRHAITKMSHLHFVSTERHARRIVQLGEQPEQVHVTGAPGLDNVMDIDWPDISELEDTVGISLASQPILATFHPVTLEPQTAIAQVGEMLAALDDVQRPTVITYPNADAEGKNIIGEIDRFVKARPWAMALPNLGVRRYFGLMRIAFAMVGNSSSGIIEAASFGLPVINIGDRQRGRTHGENVIDVPPGRAEILGALKRAADEAFRAKIAGMVNPYGDGKAGVRIAEILRNVDLVPGLLKKKFRDMDSTVQMMEIACG